MNEDNQRMNRTIVRHGIIGAGIVTCILLYVSFHRTVPVGILSARRWDKLYQAVFLVPGLFGVSYLLSIHIRYSLRSHSKFLSRSRLPFILTCAGFLLLICTSYFILGHMPRSKDEAQYLFQGKLLVSGNLWAPAPPCPEAFDIRGIKIDGDRWVPAYDPGHSLLIGIGDLFGAGWVVGPLMGAVFLWLLWLLGEQLYDGRIALYGMFLALLSPFFILLAASYSYHVTSLCLTTLVLLGTAKRKRGHRWAILTGLGIGSLILVRPLAIIFIMPTLIYLEIIYIREHRKIPVSRWWRLAIVILPFLLLYLLYNQMVTGHPLITGRQFLYPHTLFGFGTHAAHGESYGSMGHSPLKGFMNVLIQFSTLSTGLFGWPLISLLPAAIGFCCRKRSTWEWAFFLMLATTAAVLFFSWYSAIEHGPRHYLDSIPGILLLSAAGLRVVFRRLGKLKDLNPDVLMIAMLLGLFSITLFLYIPVRIRDIRGPWLGVDPVIRDVFREKIDLPAVIFMEYPENPADYYASGFVFNDPFLEEPIIFARHLGLENDLKCLDNLEGRNAYLLRYDPDSRDMNVRKLSGYTEEISTESLLDR